MAYKSDTETESSKMLELKV